MKKFLSLIMAAALVFALAIPAFAATEKETTVTGKVTEPTVAITVPKLSIILNPYRLALQDPADKTRTITDGVIVTPVAIVSNSNVPLQYKVVQTKGSGTSANVSLVAADPADSVTGKTVHLTINFMPNQDPKTVPATVTANPDTAKIDCTDNGVTLAADASRTIPLPTDAKVGSALWMGVTGAVSKGNPTSTDGGAWSKEDVAEVGLAFTFIPVINTPAAQGGNSGSTGG